jgi:hypothetical protein
MPGINPRLTPKRRVPVRWILVQWMWLPWDYIMGPEPNFTRRIPGLKIETWGTRPISFEGTG